MIHKSKMQKKEKIKLSHHFGSCEEDVLLGGDEVELGEGEGLEEAAVDG
jgi:hypothetical protein